MNNLTEIIRSRIRANGPINFAEFMELALYHPNYGYYCSDKPIIGKQGDFYTSLNVNKAFGITIGHFISKSFDLIDEDNLYIIELGAGKGTLALDILNHLQANNPKRYELTTYILVEQSESSRNEARSILSDHINQVKCISSLLELEGEKITGVFISNEFFDALPFHRLKYVNQQILEIFVTIDKECMIETLGEPSSKELGKYINNISADFIEDQEFEINLKAKTKLEQIGKLLHKGFVLTIDYGYLSEELFNPQRMKGTYKCIYQHSINENPYNHVGEQDITAHVDFSNLIKVGESLGINNLKYTTQGQFLIDWGILDLIDNTVNKTKTYNFSEQETQSIKNLFLPELMGDKFKVLVQEINLEDKISNYYPQSPFKISFKVL